MNAPSTESRKANGPLERAAGGATGQKHNLDHNADRNNDKAFSTWQARYAMHGHSLYQVHAANGATAFLATRWGMVRELANLDDVAKFFVLIGGKL